MISLLERLFAEKLQAALPIDRRHLYGSLCSAVGIFLNICLFAAKYLAGVISGSIAVTADAFNNLSDAGSSIVTLLGFRLASRKPDSKHPFGHGRMEYLSGLLVSMAIVVVGIELLRSSVDKIRSPRPIDAGYLTLGILAVSILIKGYMFFYNHRIGTKLNAAGMKATALDSVSDAIATTAVLIAAVVQRISGWQIDGYVGALVALFILYAGGRSVWETVQPLLGQMPDPELVEQIEQIVLTYPEVQGIHDLVVHDYGPGRLMVSLHAEVDGTDDIYVLHDAIDRAEQELHRTLHCEAVIHMDPIAVGDEATDQKRELVLAVLQQKLDPAVTIHDFRMVAGPTHTNVIFDMVVPFSVKGDTEELKKQAEEAINQQDETLFAVIQVDRIYAEKQEK